MDAFFTTSGLLALITLKFLEIVLGVDNVIFISILSSKLPGSQQGTARRTGLLAAMGMRILLLLSLVWIIGLTAPLFSILGQPHLRARFHPDRRWPVSTREGDDRNSRAFGARRRPQLGAGAAVVCRCHYPDRFAGYRFFAGFSHYRRRHGRRNHNHGYSRDPGRRRDNVISGTHQLLRQSPSDGKSPRAVIFTADCCLVDRRRPRHAHTKRLHLLCDKLLSVCGSNQPARPESRCACSPA
jgi:hypothetical protein